MDLVCTFFCIEMGEALNFVKVLVRYHQSTLLRHSLCRIVSLALVLPFASTTLLAAL